MQLVSIFFLFRFPYLRLFPQSQFGAGDAQTVAVSRPDVVQVEVQVQRSVGVPQVFVCVLGHFTLLFARSDIDVYLNEQQQQQQQEKNLGIKN